MSVNPSLQKRLAFGLTMVLVLVMVCQWLVVSVIIQHVTEGYMLSRLAHDAENLLANLDFQKEGGPVLNPSRIDTIYTQPWSGHYYLIQVQTTILRSRSLWDEDFSAPQGIFTNEHQEIRPGPKGQTLLAFTRSYDKQKKQINITVAEDMSNLNHDVNQIQIWYAVISSLTIVWLLIMQRRIVRQALMPLDAAKKEVLGLEQGEVSRLSTGKVPTEIVPFLTAINRLLAILTERLERSRHAAGNMAHAIKTPLTVLMQLAESKELETLPELRGKIQKQIDAIRALTGRELKKIRMAGSDAPAMRVNITIELFSLLDALQHIHKARDLHFDIHIPSAISAIADREDLLELSGNLLDNACKWAASTVRLTVTCDVEFHLIVEDDGQGCAPEHYQQILQRGERLDRTIHGHGIGLAVVKEIVADYGGRLELGKSKELTGFCVRVALPLKGLSCVEKPMLHNKST